ncbi:MULTISPECIES: outer membrane channel protein TolC [Corallincola]|uniref:Outer membrane channel protein TolC n=3 Tax=Corallincola TaxID=1775176 RepID=A0A368NR53_9GAMM|nr:MULTISPECIES: outer membrane channel protein TolC [Corallincola]RCU51751.1 outer membrane channel protein TolC [Corallincola holothuriorum]TAA47241.1 outer membrane channel protein TolC [Corallincola spongiicola]TCI04904.1 outer membrane channel protein TolC [Corallincola luteus]
MVKKPLSLAVTLVLGSLTSSAFADDIWQIYEKSLEADPVILRAAAQRQQAFEAIKEARATLLPQISVTGQYTDTSSNRNFREGDGTSASVGLTQEIYRQESWISLDLAEKSAHQADVNYNLELQRQILRVADAYFEVLQAMDDVEFIRAEKRAIERQLEQTKQRFAVGLTAITDVHEAQAEYDRSAADEIVQVNVLENSYEGLRVLTGLSHRDLDILNTDLFSPAKPQPESAQNWQTIAKDKSLSLASARVATDIAKQNIDLAAAGHMPTLSLFAQYDTSNIDSNLNNGPDSYDDQTIGLQVSVPIYTGGAITSREQQAQYAYVATSEQMNETYREVNRVTISSYNDVIASISAIRAFEQTVVSRVSALQATEAGFEVGTRTIVDVLDATRNLYDAKAQLSSARYAYVLSVLSLKFAAGNLTEQDLKDVNKGLKRPA